MDCIAVAAAAALRYGMGFRVLGGELVMECEPSERGAGE